VQPNNYCKQEEIDAISGLKKGFATTSGKVELYSEILEKIGGDPYRSPKNLRKKRRISPDADERRPVPTLLCFEFSPD
jgi:hypothetical protein